MHICNILNLNEKDISDYPIHRCLIKSSDASDELPMGTPGLLVDYSSQRKKACQLKKGDVLTFGRRSGKFIVQFPIGIGVYGYKRYDCTDYSICAVIVEPNCEDTLVVENSLIMAENIDVCDFVMNRALADVKALQSSHVVTGVNTLTIKNSLKLLNQLENVFDSSACIAFSSSIGSLIPANTIAILGIKEINKAVPHYTDINGVCMSFRVFDATQEKYLGNRDITPLLDSYCIFYMKKGKLQYPFNAVDAIVEAKPLPLFTTKTLKKELSSILKKLGKSKVKLKRN